jgi:hypothetical protein
MQDFRRAEGPLLIDFGRVVAVGCAGEKKPSRNLVLSRELVAGIGFEPMTFGL